MGIMNDSVSAIQNNGGDVIYKGETWERNISIDDDFSTGDYLIFKVVDAAGETIIDENFTEINEDGSIDISLSSADTADLAVGRYTMRIFVSIGGEAPYIITSIPDKLYVRI